MTNAFDTNKMLRGRSAAVNGSDSLSRSAPVHI